ncbi:MAG: HAD family hydrolase [Synechococcus sp.]|nr:HAD family hydrolase [Synechococcus sp.]
MGFRLLHLHLHGLFRSRDLELGRDADTGGQTLYVLELARGLAARSEVDRVEVVTRLIQDRRVSQDYACPEEPLAPGASILRIPFGPRRYLRKEQLWPHLDELADQLVARFQDPRHRPDWIHAHYADAGYVGALVSRRLGIPLVFTGHSLGREKLRRLLASGGDHKQIEDAFSITRRIDAEELALAHADLVITSTRQEATEQYSRYGRFQADRAQVVPPGVDARRFYPQQSAAEMKAVESLLTPFLRHPERPPLLAISRAVRRKNIPALVEAFGRSPVLRERHNLVLVLGCREDPRQLEKQQREVFQQVFDLVDRYDLYGQVAYPKQHRRDQIPAIYRWAAKRHGLFVNPALTEPFGLTLLEAAACGLPMVATDDGGPRDILARCDNGLLVDVTDLEALEDGLERAGSDQARWHRWSDNGIEAVSRHFSWDAHICSYLALMEQSLKAKESACTVVSPGKAQSPLADRLLLLDLDQCLDQPEGEGLVALRQRLERDSWVGQPSGLGILTGRSLAAARQRFADLHLPDPGVWITRAGTEIVYGSNQEPDPGWSRRIGVDWNRGQVEKALQGLGAHLQLQEPVHQAPYKISYLLRQSGEGILPLVRQRLRLHHQAARPSLRCHWFLDVVPLRASRSEAIRYLSLRWGLPLEQILVVASEQGDGELVRGLPATVVLAEHDPSLDSFRHQPRVFFASRQSMSGVLEGLQHYRFLTRR